VRNEPNFITPERDIHFMSAGSTPLTIRLLLTYIVYQVGQIIKFLNHIEKENDWDVGQQVY
jgi:hypothetical protein